MALKPQDILILLELVASRGERLPLAQLASHVQMSVSEVHSGLRRSIQCGLALKEGSQVRPVTASLEEFLLHGLRYAFPAESGGLTRGIPTAYAAPPLSGMLAPSNDPPPVWPDPEGDVRGLEVSPIYASAPAAAKRNPQLYELLALIDALRIGRARERELAENELVARLRAC